jgi:hypothetical protein
MSNNIIVQGVEPLNESWRSERWAYLASKPGSAKRYMLLCDTGAPDNAAGREWLMAFAKDSKIEPIITPFRSKLSGIGSGSADIREKWGVQTGLVDCEKVTHEGLWTAQCLDGIGAKVPPLWGLSSQVEKGTMFDFRDPQQLNCSCTAPSKPNGRATFNLTHHHGHTMLAVDWGGFPLHTTAAEFVRDPLGLDVWLTNEPEETSVENADPSPIVEKEFDISVFLPTQTVQTVPVFDVTQYYNTTETTTCSTSKKKEPESTCQKIETFSDTIDIEPPQQTFTTKPVKPVSTTPPQSRDWQNKLN